MSNKNFSCEMIVQDLARQITNRKLAPGVQLPTGRELARSYRVSQKTVERAMAHLCQQKLIFRVRGKGTFVLSHQMLGHKLRAGFLSYRHRIISVDSPQLDFIAFGYLEEQIQLQLTAADYHWEHIAVTPESLKDFHPALLNKFDVLIIPPAVLNAFENTLRKINIPKILICGDTIHFGPWHQLVYDYRPGFAQAIKIFLANGYRKIMVTGYDNLDISHTRMKIFREEARRLGVSEGDIIDYSMPGNPLSYVLSGQEFAEIYLKNHWFDRAIFCTSDFMAIGITSVFKRHQLQPGRDFQLISYDNFESFSENWPLHFGFSSITHPQKALAEALIVMLNNLERAGQTNDFYKIYMIPAQELIVRESTSLK